MTVEALKKSYLMFKEDLVFTENEKYLNAGEMTKNKEFLLKKQVELLHDLVNNTAALILEIETES